MAPSKQSARKSSKKCRARLKQKKLKKKKMVPPSNTSSYIDPKINGITCQESKKSLLFWRKEIPAVYPDLPPYDKCIFINEIIAEAYASLHNPHLREILALLCNSSQDDKDICDHINQLLKGYTMRSENFNCNCLSVTNEQVFEDIQIMGKAVNLPQKVGDPWVNIVDPHYEDTTCEGAEKSSLFWISKIKRVVSCLSKGGKVKFIKDMISQPHACLHKDYHKKIIDDLRDLCGNRCQLSSHILELKRQYDNINIKFVCTCGLELSDKIKHARKEWEICEKQKPPKIKVKKEATVSIVNPYLGNTTCEGFEKSSLFWLRKIREGYSMYYKIEKIKFVQDMIAQVHACHHKDFHKIIIEELKAGASSGPGGPKKLIRLVNQEIPKLAKEYRKINHKFKCTCGSSITKTLHNKKVADSSKTLNSLESRWEDRPNQILPAIDIKTNE